ncbi:MAG: hypothetical protein A2X34_00360 [Elusimicrobia bacterium GWC2_51_8]|nr:MAG: hypothetical protein A2X33_04590 [Elusimicrobia bacterium GWA2_51_34]OGR62891.1 MAG: hypothetical protein A2X34_00360 [Elusimicrobia bacterium GWC2_51_8]OGR87348.1 MAG: hypothetical protein A2021_07975 [Elusimicrobia bacterium GWF2_52_66]HAF94934.1 hypothetical protein [Elusimicrobiota bacterium]HCE97492.1 hypothetical protein [Elusimicrobiota bacterium]
MTENETAGIKKGSARWKWFFLNQKYRFDMGHQFLVILNFALLVIATSDKLRYYTYIPRTWILLLVAVPAGFGGVWLFGYLLDKARYGQAYIREAGKRNPVWEEQNAALQRIESELSAIKNSLEQRKAKESD